MKPKRVSLHIDSLALDRGREHWGDDLGPAIERELSELLAGPGLPAAGGFRDRLRLDASAASLEGVDALGRDLARAVHGVLRDGAGAGAGPGPEAPSDESRAVRRRDRR